LPRRFIELYSYLDDLVLDPFLGSGSTAVAAVETGRRYVGYDIDEGYLRTARERVLAAHPYAPPPDR
jgi:site-specific DNA-methyltransferase (adenine-specific)